MPPRTACRCWNARTAGRKTERLSVADLTVWFGQEPDRVTAVHDAAFDVAQGESFGLVGESGSGKSTILRAIAGLIPGWSATAAWG